MLHSIITPATQPCHATRAQLLLNGRIAQIDAAIQALRGAKGKLLASIYDGHSAKLNSLRCALIHDLDNVLAAPLGAIAYYRHWNRYGFGPNVLSACEAVDDSIARIGKPSYQEIRAARWAGLEVVS